MKLRSRTHRTALTTFAALAAAASTALPTQSAFAWGDEGHEIVALVAQHYLTDATRARAFALIAADPTDLTPHTFANEATWADKFRDSDRNTTKVHYNQTHQWHFVDIEIDQPDQDAACFNHPPLTSGQPASLGPENDCVVDKIEQFVAELKAPGTSDAERIEALQFIMHFVGDLHQPLHASDDHDQGGNAKKISAKSLKSGKLHGYWDTQLVEALGTTPQTVATSLIAQVNPAQLQQWSAGGPRDWAQETFQVGQQQAYGKLPKPNANGVYVLSAGYTKAGSQAAATQLTKAGVRLAYLLNDALGEPARQARR